MSSRRPGEPLDLSRGLPTTPEDVAALRAASRPYVSPEELVRFLASFPPPTTEELRRKPGPRGEPFRLGPTRASTNPSPSPARGTAR